jgi:hypothetical protein
MKKKTVKKLSIQKQTLRNLHITEQYLLKGGAAPRTLLNTCFSFCLGTCFNSCPDTCACTVLEC